MRNFVFSNLVITQSNRGIGIFARDKDSIEHVLFNNITMQARIHSGHWWGKGEPIHISTLKDRKDAKAGTIKDILFSNISAVAETGIVIKEKAAVKA